MTRPWNPIPGAAGSLDDLSDVDLTTTAPSPGDAFVFDGTDWVPGTVGGAGALLNSIYATALANVGTTSSSYADVDDPDMAIAFTVPASESVFVRATGFILLPAATGYGWNLREGTSDLSGTNQYVGYQEGATSIQMRVSATFKITGLTAGASKTYKLGHARLSGSGTPQFRGSGNGPSSMEVFAA